MRLTPLSITKSIIICNIFIFACVQAKETSEPSADGDADGDERNRSSITINYNDSTSTTINSNNNVNTNFNNRPPPALLSLPTLIPQQQQQQATTTSNTPNYNKRQLSSSSSSSSSPHSSSTSSQQPQPQQQQHQHQSQQSSSYNLMSTRRQTNRKVCSAVHIRNDLKSFEQLKDCTIIDGPLTIALVSNKTHPYEPKDYENITFPHLREITEYLLFFRVQGLTTLSKLFPNLAVIRGTNLVDNYALIIYEMMHLQNINLPKLSDILRGNVRIENNANLCFASTVNWEGICKHIFTTHFMKDNNPRCDEQCPASCRSWKSALDRSKFSGHVKISDSLKFCWNSTMCHEQCQSGDGIALPKGPNGGCCSPQCAGGCYLEDAADKCIACRHVSQGDRCVERCDKHLFEYGGHCITEQACTSMVDTMRQTQCAKTADAQTSISNLKAVHIPILDDKGKTIGTEGRCQATCPPGFEEDTKNKNKCRPCDRGKCRKVCTPEKGSEKPFMVTNVNTIKELAGCTSINGSLEISIKGEKTVLTELEKAFQDLEEIKGYLKITRSYPILTLSFLRSLKAINGSSLDRDQYSLIIIDNPNLQELFIFNQSDSNQKQLTILNGKIFVHLNPKLCPFRINNLNQYASVAAWDESDVSIHTNGDKEACNTTKLHLEYVGGSAVVSMIRFDNFALQMDDPRALLYYLINYREVPNGTVTMFHSRDGCNSQNDPWQTIEESPVYEASSFLSKADAFQEVVIDTKPATRYALYVKTFTILSGTTGALSDIIYFETAPDTPGIPREIESSATSHESVRVSWSPPSKPNGIIERYFVAVSKAAEMDDIQNLDVCDGPGSRIDRKDSITSTLTSTEPVHSIMLPQQSRQANSPGASQPGESSIPTCSRSSPDNNEETRTEVLTFQDNIINIVYLKQPCVSIARNRRSIEHYVGDSVVIGAGTTTPLTRNDIVPPGARQQQEQSQAASLRPTVTKVRSQDFQSNVTEPKRIYFDKTRGKIEVNITVAGNMTKLDRFVYNIVNLTHFSMYTIEIVACHGEFVSTKAKPSKSYQKCSIQAITQVRTHPIEDYDRVEADSVLFNPANETVKENIFTWKKPDRPNGKLLGFHYRYRVKGSGEVFSYGCVNITNYTRYGGAVLENINPGTYLFSVQTISLYSGSRYWTEPEVEFEISQNMLSATWIAFIVVLSLLVPLGAVAFGTIYYQKKQHELMYASVNPDYIQYEPDKWEVEKEKLTLGSQIGNGSFGMVYKGLLTTEKGSIACAIKTVPANSTTKQRTDFLREASIMKEFDTFHVVKLIGVISITNPVFVIMEFMENGDLKAFLRKQREVHQRENKTLVDGIYLMAAQIADGMAYLASKKFVHRDLAARNCMVGENQIVKIGDFGLTRDVYANDYYRRDTQGRLPVRWMAPESISDNMYTSASDAWSYGIVTWEIVTFGAYPYQGWSNDEVIKRVVQGFTMPKPDNCPDKLWKIMERCWRRNERSRPSFNDIVEFLIPETEDKLYPNCFFRKQQKPEAEIMAQSIPEESSTGAESYPLLSWPANRANGLTNGVNHHNGRQQEIEAGDH